MRRLISRSVSASASASRSPATSAAPRSTLAASASASSSSKMASNTSSSVAARRIHATAQQLKPAAALATTATSYPTTHERIQTVENTPYFIDNKFVQSTTDKFIDLPDPATNHLVTRVPADDGRRDARRRGQRREGL